MDPSRPSRTAIRVALRRAAHQLYDDPPLVLTDPIALRILGPHAPEVDRTPGRMANRKARPHSVAMRAFVVARSRYAEDLLAHGVRTGVSQYVVLGAGLDTFAHRNPYEAVRVFEVDHPATQDWKREILREAGLAHPTSLTYVPVDLERELLAAALLSQGVDPSKPAFFAWLGVVPYLTLHTFRAVLGFIADGCQGSGVVLDYEQPKAVLPVVEQLARESRSYRARLVGEDLKLFFTAEQMRTELERFTHREDLGTAELNVRYFGGRTDRLKAIGEAPRIASGWL